MFCTQCGRSIADNSQFCPYCGARAVPPSPPSQPPVSPPQPPQPPAPQEGDTIPFQPNTPAVQTQAPPPSVPPIPPQPEDPQPPTPKKRRPLLLAGAACLALVVVAGGVFAFYTLSRQNAARQAAQEGADALADGDYGQAVESYEKALEYRPKDVELSLDLARACLLNRESRDARQALADLSLSESDENFQAFQQLQALAALGEDVTVNTDAFPTVQLELPLESGSPFPLTADNLTLSEGDNQRSIQSVETSDDSALITYLSEESSVSEEARSLDLSLSAADVTLHRSADYLTPHFDPARLRLVSTDVSQYPIVRAYFQVTDEATGETLSGLTERSFQITEQISGGEYLARTVRSAAPLEGNGGLNINLVADKSDSISLQDMEKIQSVMGQFVNQLHYELGDQAEVLAFDSIVQQMCYYTSDTSLLVNGINSMSTDGRTALYNALYDGVTHSALQGGARCVIAFTDGMDNESTYTPQEIISYAQTQQVPIYIIGVGSQVEASTLRTIAQSTGGRYWYIDDLYDLQAIFQQVYTEQKELYVVEYESDSAAGRYAPRTLDVQVSGDGHRASASVNFTPARSVNDSAPAGDGSRYQIFAEALSWEAASRKCQEMGGHLATITSQAEMDQITQMADAQGLRYLWLGGYTSYDDGGNVFGHWVTGEPFSYQAWGPDEPSRVDQDGANEWYIMLWNIESMGGWNWNDQRNDPAAVVPTMAKTMGYVCEFES